MKTRKIYICGICNKEFSSYDECLKDELIHLGITEDIYEQWKKLDREVKRTACELYITKNKGTESANDIAIKKQIEFEQQYCINKNEIELVG